MIESLVDRLSEEGFLQVSGNDGTLVAYTPQHLYRHAPAFERNLGGELWIELYNGSEVLYYAMCNE